MNKCALCGKSSDLFQLGLTTEDNEPYKLHVCGTCWDVTAAIAKLANFSLNEKITQLEDKIDKLEKLVAAMVAM